VTINYAKMSKNSWMQLQMIKELIKELEAQQRAMPMPFRDDPGYEQISYATDLLRMDNQSEMGKLCERFYNIVIKNRWIINVHLRDFEERVVKEAERQKRW
jgi:hypothetical protein